MRKVYVPPIKCQGIKTKLVPLIVENTRNLVNGKWYEPFMGSGVVGFNVMPEKALFSDINPHIVNFYNSIKTSNVTPCKVKTFLLQEGQKLASRGEDYYYHVRERFNRSRAPLDFLFLSRSCFNGMIRFNRKGYFNVPFCKKPERFSKSYITKIVNQVANVEFSIKHNMWEFECASFTEVIKTAKEEDFIYCDPPYLGRHVDYFDSWNEDDEMELHRCLSQTNAHFILSTWHSNRYRNNPNLETIWKDFHIVTKEHFYHVGAHESNRNSILEALVMNFRPLCTTVPKISPVKTID